MQTNSKTLEPFDYQSEKEITLPSIFTESFSSSMPLIADNNSGVNQIINQFEYIKANYNNYQAEKKKLSYDGNTKRYFDSTSHATDDLARTNDNIYNDDILDKDGYQRYRPRLIDAQKEDGQTMLIQQNSMYIIGMITTATLLITAIMLAR